MSGNSALLNAYVERAMSDNLSSPGSNKRRRRAQPFPVVIPLEIVIEVTVHR
jgi:hypothetical protein